MKLCESFVTNHQMYSDTYQQTHDWLTTQADKLDVCAEPSGDKHSIQNKLLRLEVSGTRGKRVKLRGNES